MLESNHDLLVKALQQLYTHCIKNECFPGEPIDVVDGNPCTHAILDRLGLIKQAEEAPEKLRAGDNSVSPPSWRDHPTFSESVDSDELTPEPPCPLELSPSSDSASVSPSEFGIVKTEASLVGSQTPYSVYHCTESVWPIQAGSPIGQYMDINHTVPHTGFNLEVDTMAGRPHRLPSYLNMDSGSPTSPSRERPFGLSRPRPPVDNSTVYLEGNVPGLYPGQDDHPIGLEPQYSWIPHHWNR
ncbi:hypothetical protein FQN50_003970 [Emmonsiellopsis sp. PD_5]|nr:hypothetical protein FQN50_003970 [Emmonsiellopsis sp. PD_5]